jgi:hypothetical protein
MTRQTPLFFSALLVPCVACGSAAPVSSGSEPANDFGGAGGFVAYPPNFAGYHAWPHIDVTDDAGGGGVAHLDTALVEYMKAPPPPKGTPFPVGTLIVKQGNVDGLSAGQAFAMAKRGDGYNSAGASGWEWFELQTDSDASDEVEILWRGVAPPTGQMYAGKVNGDCNHCHMAAPHDGVFAE